MDLFAIRVALARGGGVGETDRRCSGVIGGASLVRGGVSGHVLNLSSTFSTSSLLQSVCAGEGAYAGGFAIGLGIAIAGRII